MGVFTFIVFLITQKKISNSLIKIFNKQNTLIGNRIIITKNVLISQGLKINFNL